MLRATTDWKDMMEPDIAVHFVCIPTEKEGARYDDILIDVIKKIAKLKDVKHDRPPIVIVESTLTPGRSDELVLPIFKEAG
ncbi:MAG: nucleotide sugar dehydrogenase, partial [Candidatus Aenigmarchaeota archaeon]|nr:nucleotide sugar dehydrogenase [Candidatus Aenigmarchaeota archaeon]